MHREDGVREVLHVGVLVAREDLGVLHHAVDVPPLIGRAQLAEVPDVVHDALRDRVDAVREDRLSHLGHEAEVGLLDLEAVGVAGGHEDDVMRNGLDHSRADRALTIQHDLADQSLQRRGVELVEEYPQIFAFQTIGYIDTVFNEGQKV